MLLVTGKFAGVPLLLPYRSDQNALFGDCFDLMAPITIYLGLVSIIICSKGTEQPRGSAPKLRCPQWVWAASVSFLSCPWWIQLPWTYQCHMSFCCWWMGVVGIPKRSLKYLLHGSSPDWIRMLHTTNKYISFDVSKFPLFGRVVDFKSLRFVWFWFLCFTNCLPPKKSMPKVTSKFWSPWCKRRLDQKNLPRFVGHQEKSLPWKLELMKLFFGVWSFTTVDGWNPANQLRLVVYPIIFRVLLHPRWLFGISAINSGYEVYAMLKLWIFATGNFVARCVSGRKAVERSCFF